MANDLTAEQQASLHGYAARGEFPSVEAAAPQLIDEHVAKGNVDEDDDLAWAKPLVDEGLADIDRGDVISRGEHQARMAKRLEAPKG